MAKGIEERHSRACRSRKGGRCDCEPSYRADVWDRRQQRRIRRTFSDRAEATTWRRDALIALRRGREAPGRSRETLETVCTEWLELARSGVVRTRSGEVYKPSAVRSYEQSLRLRVYPELGAEPVSDVGRVDLQDLVDSLLAEGLSASTIQTTIIPLRAILKREVARGRISGNPTIGLNLPAVRTQRDRIASPAEAVKLLAAVPERDRGIWATAMYAGLRHGELKALRVENVRLDEGVVHVVAGWDRVEGEIETKGRNRRKVPICSPLREMIAADLLRTGRRATPQARIFGTSELSPFAGRDLSKRADKAWAAAGLNRITLHECRHTFASYAIAAGVNAKALSEYMGHANIQITFDRYGHLMPGNEEQAAGLLDAYLSAQAGRAGA